MLDLPDLEFIKPGSKEALKGPAAAPFLGSLCEGPAGAHREVRTRLEGGDAVVVDNFLTKEECAALCAAIDESPALSFWSAAGRQNAKARAFRDADTIEVDSVEIAQNMWKRVEKLLEEDCIDIAEDPEDYSNDTLWERELPGKWKPVNFNHDLLFVRYPSNGAFSPHTDGKAIHDFNTRSFYSVIVFLNDIEEGQGGGTRFYKKEALQHLDSVPEEGGRWTADRKQYETLEVEPKAGRLLFFDQRLVHEGVPPTAPFQKYIIRSDVIYKRVEPVCDSEGDREAYRMYREAEVLAEAGEVNDSISLFRKALKKSPTLAVYMGQ